MKVEDILRTKDTRINTVRVNESVETAMKLMKADNIGALVVKDVCRTEGNTVVGIISERDVIRALVERGSTILKQPVAGIMSRNLVTCGPGDPVRNVFQAMDEHTIRHVPVMDGFTLVGIVSIRDLIRLQLSPPSEEPWTFVAPVRRRDGLHSETA